MNKIIFEFCNKTSDPFKNIVVVIMTLPEKEKLKVKVIVKVIH
jgi:hypothetical protein